MAGCFGNNFYDRSMEAQLFRHLDSLEELEDDEELENEKDEEELECNRALQDRVERDIDRIMAIGLDGKEVL